MSYKLINPYIEGTMSTSYSATTPIDAANQAWQNMSKYFKKNVPKFAFTLQSGGKMHHFLVKESIKDKKVVYNINEMTIKDKNAKSFTHKLNDLTGGKHDLSSSSSSSSSSSNDSSTDSEYELVNLRSRLNTEPIYYFWYDPYMYDLSSVSMPIFVDTITPYLYVAGPTYAVIS